MPRSRTPRKSNCKPYSCQQRQLRTSCLKTSCLPSARFVLVRPDPGVIIAGSPQGSFGTARLKLHRTGFEPSLSTRRLKVRTRVEQACRAWGGSLADAGSIPAASTIFRRTTRLSGVAPRRDERPQTPWFQRVWAFLTSFPLCFPPVEFVLLRSFSFSVCNRSVYEGNEGAMRMILALPASALQGGG